MYYIIVNPASKSGQGARIWSQIRPVLDKRKIQYKLFFSRAAGNEIRLTNN